MPEGAEPDGPAAHKPEAVEVLIIEEDPSWTQPFLTYLANDELPVDELTASSKCLHHHQQ